MARRNKYGRNISGILVLDKPAGISSNGALQQVKRIYNANKAGHTGSLDVPATGVLPICLGQATKISGYLLNADKTYAARCKLGTTTTTGDASGQILTSGVARVSAARLEQALTAFLGEIEQIPPMYSAVKHRGKRLYELAYQGKAVERKARKVTVHALKLEKLEQDEFEINVVCSKGTYIRTLVEDLGNLLGCGAHILTLCRLGSGPFKQQHTVTPEQLQSLAEAGAKALDKLLFPMDFAVMQLPRIDLSEDAAYYLYRGQAVAAPNPPASGRLRLYTVTNQFIGLGERTEDGRVAPRRLINNEENHVSY